MCGQDEIERQGSVLVDYADLTGDQTVRKALPNLTTELKEQPEMMLNCLGVAIHQVYANMLSGATTCKHYAKMVNSLLNHYFILYTVCTCNDLKLPLNVKTTERVLNHYSASLKKQLVQLLC